VESEAKSLRGVGCTPRAKMGIVYLGKRVVKHRYEWVPRPKHTKNAAGAPGVNPSDPRVNGLRRLSLLLSTAICSCTSNTENEQLFAGLQSSY
jgi:hypothetical protein